MTPRHWSIGLQIADDMWREKHPVRAETSGGHGEPGERLDQRLVDALIELGRGEVMGSGKPVVIVTVDAETLEAELIGDGPVPTEAVEQLLVRADVYALVRGARGVTLNFGRSRRLATAMQRLIVAARDQCCQYEGCRRSYRYCEVHHSIEFGEGGSTDVESLVLLCGEHHHHLHNHGKTIRRVNGEPVVFDRDGQPIGTGPPGQPTMVAA